MDIGVKQKKGLSEIVQLQKAGLKALHIVVMNFTANMCPMKYQNILYACKTINIL